jgi:hypothetical protein
MDTNHNILTSCYGTQRQLRPDQMQSDLRAYRGWTILLQWGTYNDGAASPLCMLTM